MKYCILLVVVALWAGAQSKELTEEQRAGIKAVETTCVEKSKVDAEKIKKFRQGTPDETDPKLKEYMLCFFRTAGGIDEAGEFQKELIEKSLTERLGEEGAKKVLAECLVKKATPQETAFEYAKCTYKHRPGGYSNIE